MRRALVLVALIATAAAAQAQTPRASTATTANVSGYWAFETDTYAEGCKMTGVMTIRPAANGQHICTFEAHEQCPSISVRAKETCTAKRSGSDLAITAKVTSTQPEGVGYEPDDFELKIRDGSFMSGMMRSFNSAPVKFFRGDAPIS